MARFTVSAVAQKSPEWFAARAGRLTGSSADAILAKPRKGAEESVQRRDYRLRLACERLTGQSQEEDVHLSADMQRGNACEPQARAAYEIATGHLVLESGFLSLVDAMAGCSLDGHVGDFAGIVEIKCPKTATHLAYVEAGTVPADYLPQITHNLWVSGAQWCDFISYDDRIGEELALFVVRVPRDEAVIAAYVAEAEKFLAEVDAKVGGIQALKAKRQQAAREAA